MNVPAHNMAECHGGARINASAQVLDVDGISVTTLTCNGAAEALKAALAQAAE